ncbi:MAG: DNA-J related domain-containing protein [Thiogranum sp.]
MRQTHSQLPGVFYSAIEQELAAQPAGIHEYDLIKVLRARGFFGFLPKPPAAPHQLFRAHFLLFHALYELRDRLAASQQGLLQIEPLRIRRLPWSSGPAALATPDPLRAYYLDWTNLENTSEDEVCELIASFWNRLGRFEGRGEALAELGLKDPVDDAAIKSAWRRLAMEHHPDRGGDNERLQLINAAVDSLIGKA